MAIPPVIANNPLLKLFKTDPQNKTAKVDAVPAPQTQEDVVEISQAAQQRLNGIETLSSNNPERIQEVSGEARDILAGDEALTLGAQEEP